MRKMYSKKQIEEMGQSYLEISCNNYPNHQFTIPTDFIGLIRIKDLPTNDYFFIYTGEKLVFPPPNSSIFGEIYSQFSPEDGNNYLSFASYNPNGTIYDQFTDVNERYLYITKYVVFIGFPINL